MTLGMVWPSRLKASRGGFEFCGLWQAFPPQHLGCGCVAEADHDMYSHTSVANVPPLSLISRYDSFGRLTNVTFPTGQVSSFRSDTDSSVHVQVETSSKDDVTITTNLSASGAFDTLLQGKSARAWGL